VLSPFVSQKLAPIVARPNKQDLTAIRELMAAGKVTPVIETYYGLREVPAAIRYLEQGHARGKVALQM